MRCAAFLILVTLSACSVVSRQRAVALDPPALTPPRITRLVVSSVVRPPWPEFVTNTVTLAWTEPTNSELAIAFYRVYFGTNSGTYYQSFDTAQPTNQTSVTFIRSRFTMGYFVAVAVTSDGIESLPSNEVCWPTGFLPTTVTLSIPGPLPAPVYASPDLTTSAWTLLTNAVTTNLTVPINFAVPAQFFKSDRLIEIKAP